MSSNELHNETNNVKIVSVNIPPKSNSNITRNGIKKIGTREEVFQGLAIKTNGGMYINDILYDEKMKKGYISKKISTRMKQKRKTLRANMNTNTNTNNNTNNMNINTNNMNTNNTNTNTNNNNNENMNNENNNISKHHQAKTMKRVIFKPENNKIFEYECDNINSLDDIDVNFSLKSSNEFKIEEIPDISIADLFE